MKDIDEKKEKIRRNSFQNKSFAFKNNKQYKEKTWNDKEHNIEKCLTNKKTL